MAWRRAFLSFAVVLVVARSVTSRADEETQQWSELKLVAKCTDKVDLFAATTLRLAEVEPTLNRVSGQLGFNLRPVRWLTFSPNYQYIVNEPAEDASAEEHRPGLVAAIGFPIASAEVTFSAGFEYRVREGRSDSWRVRPKIKLKHPFGPGEWRMAGYLANELFFDSTESDFVRDRFFAGVEKKLGDAWSLDFYYCRQHDLRSPAPDLNIVGVSMTLHFAVRYARGVATGAVK